MVEKGKKIGPVSSNSRNLKVKEYKKIAPQYDSLVS